MVLALANLRKAPSTHLLHRRPCLGVSLPYNSCSKASLLVQLQSFPAKTGSRKPLFTLPSRLQEPTPAPARSTPKHPRHPPAKRRLNSAAAAHSPLSCPSINWNSGRGSLGCPNSTAVVAWSSGICSAASPSAFPSWHRSATTVPATINPTPHDLLAAPATRQTGPAPAPAKRGRWSSPVSAPTAAARRTQRRTLRSPRIDKACSTRMALALEPAVERVFQPIPKQQSYPNTFLSGRRLGCRATACSAEMLPTF